MNSMRVLWKKLSAPAKITLVYALVGGAWILFSDKLLDTIVADVHTFTRLSTFKGWFFVLITASLLYVLIKRDVDALQRSQQALENSYYATLEGWARALDLRDRDTINHTQRVTDLTLRIARRMGMSADELEHLRRGALLHDIGKMGIPDKILLKPGTLDEHEWAEMRQHPTYAYDLLSPIAYLQTALEIPYCHHEKWDGTGYPRGLRGEEIPLGARIFAVVDVWDALLSDRPYRKAWTQQQVIEYVQANVGRQFDPRVVDVFLDTMYEMPVGAAHPSNGARKR